MRLPQCACNRTPNPTHQLTLITHAAYSDENFTSESRRSFFVSLSSISFRDSPDGTPETYHWALCAQVVCSMVGVMAARVFTKHSVAEIEDGIISSADFAVEITNLPKKPLMGDPDLHLDESPTRKGRGR